MIITWHFISSCQTRSCRRTRYYTLPSSDDFGDVLYMLMDMKIVAGGPDKHPKWRYRDPDFWTNMDLKESEKDEEFDEDEIKDTTRKM
jgi:hypothetical protein